jgi:ketosteroid isomerase-like protein
MTIQEIAARLAELCRKGQWETAHKELYAADAISIEPFASPGFEKETKGLPAIIEKGHKFDAMVETMHSITVSEPLVAANSFVFLMGMKVTMKKEGDMNMSELCVYQVKDGKIISEEFFV